MSPITPWYLLAKEANVAENSVAQTILNQLGGIGRLKAMTGARDFLAAPDGVQFHVGRNAKGVKAISVVLQPEDTYKVTFHGRKNGDGQVLHDIYAEDLQRIFESETGLYLNF